MKKTFFLLSVLCSFLLFGCTTKEKALDEESTKNIVNTGNEIPTGDNSIIMNDKIKTNENEFKEYTVKHELGNRPESGNGEDINIYLNGRVVFSKRAEDGGRFYKLIGSLLFIDYGTGPEGSNMEIIDLDKVGRTIFEIGRYNGGITISGDTMYFNYSIFPSPVGIDCPNKDQIEKDGRSLQYEQKRSYNFKTDELKNLSEIYCTEGQ